jgi:hypothetical protein
LTIYRFTAVRLDRTFASHEETACIVRGMKLTFVVKELYGAPAAAIGPGNAQTPNPDSRTLNLYHLLRATVDGHQVWELNIPIRGKKEVIEGLQLGATALDAF